MYVNKRDVVVYLLGISTDRDKVCILSVFSYNKSLIQRTSLAALSSRKVNEPQGKRLLTSHIKL